MVLLISVRGEGKREKIIKKKKKKISSFREVFRLFLVANLPEKMIRKCYGVKEKE